MKKVVIYFLVLCCSIGAAQAQLAPFFKLGLKGGLAFTQLRAEGKLLNSETKVGYQLGAWSRIGVGGIHLQPEVYYAKKKMTLNDGSVNTEAGSAEASFSSVDVPILIGTRLGLGPIGLRLQAGPVFSFSQEGEISKDNILEMENYKKTSSGIIGGLGVDINKLTVDLRYEHGLTNLNNSANPDHKLSLWTIALGISIF